MKREKYYKFDGIFLFVSSRFTLKRESKSSEKNRTKENKNYICIAMWKQIAVEPLAGIEENDVASVHPAAVAQPYR